jgi:hypothetical protein
MLYVSYYYKSPGRSGFACLVSEEKEPRNGDDIRRLRDIAIKDAFGWPPPPESSACVLWWKDLNGRHV